ncbi:MAG: carboxypeptidase-like regulatory domain-containing protein [Balneolaceae bacterium]|nr:carboxypeptidase-like regulatory domain-containing protein [Balneolaceae bacterium]
MYKILISVVVNLLATGVFAQLTTISGTVTGNSEPIEFANIYLVEAERGAITNADGRFIIERVRPGTYTLRVSFVGYQPYEKKITASYGDDISLDIKLEQLNVRG